MAKSEQLVAGVWVNVISHAILLAMFLTSAIWLAPTFFQVFDNVLGSKPPALVTAMNISNVCRHELLFLIPAIALLLWLDALLFGFLLRRMGSVAAALWSGLVSLLLAGSIILFVYTIGVPNVMMLLQYNKNQLSHHESSNP